MESGKTVLRVRKSDAGNYGVARRAKILSTGTLNDCFWPLFSFPYTYVCYVCTYIRRDAQLGKFCVNKRNRAKPVAYVNLASSFPSTLDSKLS